MAFKVLITGGSIAGLTLALVLQRAGVEYELLEKGDFAPQLGASIGLQPTGARILDQLGIWQDVMAKIVPLQHRKFYDAGMKLWDEDNMLAKLAKIEGRPVAFVERCEFLRILYSHIKDKSRLHPHTELCSYEETESGVTVTASDGKTYEGSILVGADGVHSTTRNLLAQKLQSEDKELSKALVECYTSEYKCVFAVTRNDPASPFMADAHNIWAYRKDYSTTASAGVSGLIFWFLFVKTPLTQTPHCPRFTDEDMDALIEEFGNDEVVPGATIRDFYNARVKASMVALEEGIVQKWSHGRVVMIGDAVHKVTINAGLGGNLAIEGIARLTNLLVPLIQNNSEVSTHELEGVFKAYEVAQRSRARETLTVSAAVTRIESEQNWLYNFASRWVQPILTENLKVKLGGLYSRGTTYLSFLPLTHHDVTWLEKRRAGQTQSWISWLSG